MGKRAPFFGDVKKRTFPLTGFAVLVKSGTSYLWAGLKGSDAAGLSEGGTSRGSGEINPRAYGHLFSVSAPSDAGAGTGRSRIANAKPLRRADVLSRTAFSSFWIGRWVYNN